MNLKKLMIGGIVAVMGIAFFGNVTTAASLNDAEFTSALSWAFDNGLTKYDTEDAFMPMANLSREAFAKFAAAYGATNLCLETDDAMACDFSDLDDADPTLQSAIVAACEMGLVKGHDGMFDPTASVSKAEVLTVLDRALSAAAGEEAAAEDMSPWYEGHFNAMRDLGITKETDVNAVDRAVTRYEVALMLYRARVDAPECTADTSLSDLLSDLFGDVTGDTGDTGDNTGDTGDDTGDEVLNGTVSVSLNPETPAGSDLPGNTFVKVASVDVTADDAATLKSLNLKRFGLGNDEAIQEVTLYVNGEVASNTRGFQDDATRSFTLKPNINLGAGERVTVDIWARVGAADDASNMAFSVGVIGVNDDDVDPAVVGNEFVVRNVDAVEVNVDLDTDADIVQVGEKDVEIASLTIENTDNDYDAIITSLTFEDDENNMADDMENFTLEFDGAVVATVAEVNGKYLTFTFDTPLVLGDGNTEDLTVHADVVAGIGDEVKLILDEENYVVGYDSNYHYGLAADVDTNNDPDTITIDAGDVTLEEVNADYDKIREDHDNYVLAAMDMTVNAGENIELDELVFDADVVGGCTMTGIFDDITVRIDGNTEDVETIGSTLQFKDLALDIPVGQTIHVEVLGDTQNDLSACIGDTVELSFDPGCGTSSCNNIDLEDTTENEKLIDITPSTTITFDDFEIAEPGVAISKLSQTDTSVVAGTKNVDLVKFQVETDDVSSVKFKDFKLTNLSGYNFVDDYLSKITLWRETANGWAEVDHWNGNDVNSGVLDVDGFTEIIPVDSTQVYLVTVDVTSNTNLIGDVLAEASDFTLRDDNNDLIPDTTTFDSRTVTIIGAGTLDVDFDASNTATDDDLFILGGKMSPYVAAFEVKATDEDIMVKDVAVVVTGNLNQFVDTVYKVYLSDESGLITDGDGIVSTDDTDGSVEINNINYIIPADTTVVFYISLDTKDLGDGDTTYYGTDDFRFNLEVTDAEGQISHEDNLTDTSAVWGNLVAIKPVLVSNVELSDYDTAELTDANQVIGELTITADAWANKKYGSSNTAELGLVDVTLGCTISDTTGDVLRLEASDGEYATGQCASNLVTFSFTGMSESNQSLASSESATFSLRADGMQYGTNASVSLSFNSANHGLTYKELDSTCGTYDMSCVGPTLRLGTTNFGSASASKN